MRIQGLALAALVLTAACATGPGQSAPVEEEQVASTPPRAEPPLVRLVAGMALPNARFATPTLLSTGQLSPSQMEALETLGFDRFISLRPADEEGTGWEEELTAAEGIEFIRIPVAGAEGLTRGNVESLALSLADVERMAVVSCSSGNRVGALLALKAWWLDEVPAEEALELGKAGGLTRLEPRVREILELPPEGP